MIGMCAQFKATQHTQKNTDDDNNNNKKKRAMK